MPKFYEDAGYGKRTWQCFCCGKKFEDPELFREHVIAEHEEGREFIKCPACFYPVRDLKTHYKVKHPNRLYPKGVQDRATVWRDFSPTGKKKTRKPHVQSGQFTSNKMGKDVPYRSRFECEFYEGLEADLDVLAYHAEPFKIPYYFQGKWHDYIPDLKVDYIDGTSEVWEIKPASQLEYDQNKAKWAAMNDYASNMGWVFTVQTQEALSQLKSKISRQRKKNKPKS